LGVAFRLGVRFLGFGFTYWTVSRVWLRLGLSGSCMSVGLGWLGAIGVAAV